MAPRAPGIVIINSYCFSSSLCFILKISACLRLLEQDNAGALVRASSAFTHTTTTAHTKAQPVMS
jgi:hypothetical protein